MLIEHRHHALCCLSFEDSYELVGTATICCLQIRTPRLREERARPCHAASKCQSSESNLISLTPKAIFATPKASLPSRVGGLGVEREEG